MGVDTRDQLPTGTANVIYKPNGIFWLVRVEAHNNTNQPRSLGQTTDFVLKDGLGNTYLELSNHGTQADINGLVAKQGLKPLGDILPPGGSNSTLLIFDLPRGAQPKQLTGRVIVGGNSLSPNGQVAWNLGNR